MKKIEVLMSTYNGERYLEEQINSILNQKDVIVHLTVRDDGSTDNTNKILEDFKEKNPEKIKLIFGKNEGYKKSFLDLILLSENDYDFYAFSDQDDVWLEDKSIRAIERIQYRNNNKVSLYVCSPTICDEKLNSLYINDMSDTINNIYSFFIRSRLPGCCMVFSKELKEIIGDIWETHHKWSFIPDHDFLTGSLAYLYGNVERDNSSYVLHRRLSSSVTSGGKGIMERIKTEYKLIFKNKNFKSEVAKILIENQKEDLSPKSEYLEFLENITKYKNNLGNSLGILKCKDFKSGKKVLDIEAKLKIIIKTY